MKRGTTLVELLFVLCVIGLLGAVVTMTVRQRPARSNSAPHDARRALDSVRSLVLRGGTQRTLVIEDTAALYTVTLLPDGSVVGDSLFVQSRAVDRLSGRAPMRLTGKPR